MKTKMSVMCCLIGFIALVIGSARADEPRLPDFTQTFNSEKEYEISQLESLSVADAIERLLSPDFFDDEAYLNRGVHVAFRNRTADAIEFALGYVRMTHIRNSPEGTRSLYIAKKICQIFPEESLPGLLELYNSDRPEIRANVIYVVGQMVGDPTIKALLIGALDDVSPCEDERLDATGEPLRTCDAAYNQLVVRYNIQNVLRVIGSIHRVDVRDYHIQIIKDLI
jgi:hypothetical protein